MKVKKKQTILQHACKYYCMSYSRFHLQELQLTPHTFSQMGCAVYLCGVYCCYQTLQDQSGLSLFFVGRSCIGKIFCYEHRNQLKCSKIASKYANTSLSFILFSFKMADLSPDQGWGHALIYPWINLIWQILHPP